MTTPVLPGICPCRQLAAEDGFCDERTGSGRLQSAHRAERRSSPGHLVALPDPCPHGEAWLLTPATADGDDAAWACTHRWHEGEPAAEPETHRRQSPRNGLDRRPAQTSGPAAASGKPRV